MSKPTAMFYALAARNPMLAARIAAAQGIDLSADPGIIQGGVGQDQLSGGIGRDVLTSPPAPTTSPPTVPIGRPVPKPAGAPTAPAAAAQDAKNAEAAAKDAEASKRSAALLAAGQALATAAPNAPQRAPAAPVQLSRGISDTGGLSALLGIAGQAPQGQIPLAALLRGIG